MTNLRADPGERHPRQKPQLNPKLLEMAQAFLSSRMGAAVFTTDPGLNCLVPPDGFCRECRLCHERFDPLRLPLTPEAAANVVATGQPGDETCPAGLGFVGSALYIAGHFLGYVFAGAVRDVKLFEGRLFALGRQRGERPKDIARRFSMELKVPAEFWGRLRDEVALSVATIASVARDQVIAEGDLVTLLDELHKRLGMPVPPEERWKAVVAFLCEETGADAGALVFPSLPGGDQLEVHAYNLSQSFVSGFLADAALACVAPVAHPVVLSDPASFPPPFNHPAVRAEKIRRVAHVAVSLDGGLCGAMYLFGFGEASLASVNLPALALISREIGRLRDRWRLSQENRFKEQELRIVRSLMRAAREDWPTLLQHADAVLGVGLGLPYRRLLLAEPGSDRLYEPLGQGGEREDRLARLARESYLSGRVVEVRDLADFHLDPATLASGVRAVLNIPLVSGGERLGVLQAGVRRVADADAGLRTCLEGIAAILAVLLRTRKLAETVRRSPAAVSDTLLSALAVRRKALAEHCRRVAALAWAIARGAGLPPEAAEDALLAGALHDIGYLSLPDEVLSLHSVRGDAQDLREILAKRHADLGADLVAQTEMGARLAPLVRHHHECFDGSGFPGRLRGEEIPLGARVVAIADGLDEALHPTGDLGREQPPSFREAVLAVARGAGTRYDGSLVTAFLRRLADPGFVGLLDLEAAQGLTLRDLVERLVGGGLPAGEARRERGPQAGVSPPAAGPGRSDGGSAALSS